MCERQAVAAFEAAASFRRASNNVFTVTGGVLASEVKRLNAFRSFLAVCIGALLLLSVTPSAIAYQGDGDELQFSEGPLGYVAEDGRLVVNNGNVTIWFQEYRPMVHIYSAGDGTNIGFAVAVKGIYELDQDGRPVALLGMYRPYPVTEWVTDGQFNYTSSVSVAYQETTQTVDVAFTLTASEFLVSTPSFNCTQVRALDGSGSQYDAVGQATATVVFHISAMTGYLKFDLIVDKWTWVNASGDSLSLLLTFEGHEMMDAYGGRPTADGVPVGENEGNETQLRYTVQNTYYRDSVRILGPELIEEGYITWSNTAVATYSNGTVVDVQVAAFMFNCSFNQTAASQLLFVFAVPEGWETAYASLEYDPYVGIGQLAPAAEQPEVPGTPPGTWSLHLPAATWIVVFTAAAAAVFVIALIVLSLRKD